MPAIVRRRAPHSVQVNMTPMIDVVFLLIVFFMLVSRIASEEVAQEVDLPEVVSVEAEDELPPQRIVVNLLWVGQNRAPEYRLGAMTVRSVDALEAAFRASKKETPNVHAVIRCDRRINYRYIRQVMQRVAKAEIEVMHMAVVEGSE